MPSSSRRFSSPPPPLLPNLTSAMAAPGHAAVPAGLADGRHRRCPTDGAFSPSPPLSLAPRPLFAGSAGRVRRQCRPSPQSWRHRAGSFLCPSSRPCAALVAAARGRPWHGGVVATPLPTAPSYSVPRAGESRWPLLLHLSLFPSFSMRAQPGRPRHGWPRHGGCRLSPPLRLPRATRAGATVTPTGGWQCGRPLLLPPSAKSWLFCSYAPWNLPLLDLAAPHPLFLLRLMLHPQKILLAKPAKGRYPSYQGNLAFKLFFIPFQ